MRPREGVGGVQACRASVLFVTEGGPSVGLGHVSRCLALARPLSAEGARASFLVPPEPGVSALLAGWCGSGGGRLAGRLSSDGRSEAGPEVAAVVEPWPESRARALASARAARPDVIVVDSYKASPALLASLRDLAPVIAIDDFADRPLPVDVVVNGGVAAESLPYRRTAETIFLLGSRYALLAPEFAESPERQAAARISRLLVTLGGGRATADLAVALAAADAVLDGGTIDVAAGPFSVDAPVLEAAARVARNRVVVHRDRLGLRPLMLEADLAVSGAGMTLYELSAVGTPAVTVCMADNQEPNAEAFDRAGAAPCAGRAGDADLRQTIEAALRRLAADPETRSEAAARARRLVDGHGASRVAGHILSPALARR